MPSVCLRTVSPRVSLPRKTPKRTLMKKSTNATPRSEPKGNSTNDDDGCMTPRPSRADTRSSTDLLESMSLESSLVLESHHQLSSPEAKDVVGDDFAISSKLRPLPHLPKAKRIRFYRNGDQYYKGMWYALRADRMKTMKPLMEDLTRSMGDLTALPLGIRHIFAIDGQNRISTIDEFEDGESYVVSSYEVFKPLDYASAKEPFWCFTLSRTKPSIPLGVATNDPLAQEPTDFVFPRIIVVIRNGVKPRRVVRHLLNRKTARSFEQVLNDLTSVVKLDSGVVRKLLSLRGTAVTCLQDFFVEDDVFLAYGNEKTSADDFIVTSEESKRLFTGNRSSRLATHCRVMPTRNESLREDRCCSVVSFRDDAPQHLPPFLDEMFTVNRLLGDGNTAVVFEVVERKTMEKKALKFIQSSIGKEALIDSEIRLMRQVDHRFIVHLFDSWTFGESIFLSLELVEGGDLFEHLCNVRRLDECTAARLLSCLSEALRYLHVELQCVHRDVKPENLLLYANDKGELLLKLADFGLAAQLPESGSLSTICGTPTYVAAEVLSEIGYDEKVDMWAAGVILYLVLCGFPPFQSVDGTQEELFSQILRGHFEFPSPSWDHISWTAKALILCLINVDSETRFSAQEMLDNQWITSCGQMNSDYEAMAELAVQNRFDEVQDVEETACEYYISRRASMDELREGGHDHRPHFSRSHS